MDINIKLCIHTFVEKRTCFKIFLPIKSLFEYYKINFRLSITHIKSIFSETVHFHENHL